MVMKTIPGLREEVEEVVVVVVLVLRVVDL